MTGPYRRSLAGILCCITFLVQGCQEPVSSDSTDAVGESDRSQAADFTPPPAVIEQHDRGVALMGQFDYAAAHDVFAALEEQHPTWADVKIDLAISKLNRREPDDVANAEALLDSVIRSHPDKLRAKYCRAILLLYAAEPERACSISKRLPKPIRATLTPRITRVSACWTRGNTNLH